MRNSDKIILHLCPGTGAMSKNYRDNGYDVILLDIKDGSDIRLLDKSDIRVYGILAEPPCTHLAGSGARWWREKGDKALLEALSIVDACFRFVVIYNPVFWCLENPVGRLTKYLGKPKMYFNPCDFGDPYTKKTALWGKFNMPKKNPVKPVEGSKVHKYPPSKDRAMLRSITPPGFAKSFFKANK